jgi:hypothetical protein
MNHRNFPLWIAAALAASACAGVVGCSESAPAKKPQTVLSATITSVETENGNHKEIRVKAVDAERHDVRAYDPRLVVDGVTMSHYHYDSEDTELVFDCDHASVADTPKDVVLEWGAPRHPAVRTTSVAIRP